MTCACPDCGNALLDPDEQFCGNCGCYLEWTDQPPPEPDPEPAPVQAPPAAPVGPPPARPPTVPSPRRSTLPPHQAPALTLVAPQQPASQDPGPRQPRARQPGSAAPAGRRPTAPPEPLNPGDLVCGDCGIGNKATRKFCRRCGQDLVDAPKAKVSLWGRVFKKRQPKVKEAGARPQRARAGRRRPRVPTWLITLLAVLSMLGIGAYFLRGTLLDGVGIVQDRVKGVERVVPDKVGASSTQQGHGANLVKDGTPNKYWAPADAGDGKNQYVEASFTEPVRLAYVLVTPGVSSSDEELFLQQGRPAELKMDIAREDGTHEVKTADLEDKRGPFQVTVRESDVTTIRFVILKAYSGTADGSRTAIGEIEFWVRK